jgi:hydroxyquinol 1,2-dioxygenase
MTQEATGTTPLLVTEDNITELAQGRWGTAQDPRLAELLTSLVRHLHDFAREVRLTEDEWMAGIQWLTRTGQISDEKRQEFILASDVLGLSMLVVQMCHRFDERATPATVLGPFYIEGSPEFGYAGDMSDGVDGDPLVVHGTVRDLDGRPVPGAVLDVWQADADGAYESQLEVDEARLRGRFRSREDGTYCVRTIAPKGYTIPMDGTVGDLISRTEISEYRPAHVHFRLDVPGFEPLVTHLFREGAPYLDTDVVFGTKQQLVVPFERHEGGVTPAGIELDRPWLEARYDFVLQPRPPVGQPVDGDVRAGR